jgi:hypothetical protein
MISTDNVKRKWDDSPQKLRILNTNKIKAKTGEDMAKMIRAVGIPSHDRITILPTRKYNGPMLTLGNTEDRLLNEKRKRLMAKIKMSNITQRVTPKIEEKKRRGRPKKT